MMIHSGRTQSGIISELIRLVGTAMVGACSKADALVSGHPFHDDP